MRIEGTSVLDSDEELRGIARKSVGLAEPIKAALTLLKNPLQVVLVYGSVAKLKSFSLRCLFT